MPAAGYTQTGDSVENRDDRQIRRLQYAPADPASSFDRVTIWIVADPDGDFAQLSFRQQLDPATAQLFGGWAAGMPLIDGAPIRGANFLTSASGGRRVSISTDFEIPMSEAQLREQFTAGLEGSPFSLSPDHDPANEWIDLVGENLEDVTIHLAESSDATSTRLSINARFEAGTIPPSAPAPGAEAPAAPATEAAAPGSDAPAPGTEEAPTGTEAPAGAPGTEAPAEAPGTEGPAEAPGTEAPAAGTEEAPAGTEAPAAAPGTEAPAAAPGTEAPAEGSDAPAAAPAPAGGAATIDELSAGVAALLGPTEHLAETVSPYVTLPEGLPEPAGMTVHEVTFRFNPNEAADESYYRAIIVMTVAPPAEELVSTLPAELVNAGYTQTRDSVENRDDRQIRWFDFDIPGARSTLSELSIAVIDDPDQDVLQYEVNFDLDPTGADFLDGGWIPGLPLLDGATLDGGGIRTFTLSSTRLTVDSHYNVPMPLGQAQEALLAGLEGTPYTADPDGDLVGDGWIDLTADGFESITVHLNEGFPEGTTSMRVEGQVDLG